MKKWYKEPYFNRRAWIMENCDKLNLNCYETLLLLFADYANENRIPINYEYLTKKLRVKSEDLDKIIVSLVDKKYIKLSTNTKGLLINIDGIFEFDPEKYEISDNRDLYETVGDVFGRPLTTNELQKVNDLVNEFGENEFLDALRVAEARRKVKMAYVESVLRNNHEK